MRFLKIKVWQTEEILAIAKRNKVFIVDRNMYRFSALRKKLRKIEKDPKVPIVFDGYTQTELRFRYAPEKLAMVQTSI
jgi:hypothetical protein